MLGAAWVEYIHHELLHKFWPEPEHIGARGVKDRGLLESAVGRPYQTVFAQDAYPTVGDKAAALFHSLVSNHPFHDGNKRTAVTALQHFLLANSFFAGLSNDEAYEMAKRTASYRERGSSHDQIMREIKELLAKRMIPLDAVRELVAGGSEMIGELFSISLEIRRRIRRSGMNRLVDLP
jgi:death-on-curing family protein